MKSTFPEDLRLDGLRIVIDCAHGAAYNVAPSALWELGADVIAIGVTPNGTNINDQVGSTAPEALQRKVLETRADIGIALDGDADRLIIVDERGHVVDGDQIMALIATSWHRRGLLKGGGLVATVMSNLGLERYLEAAGLTLHRTAVGDRYVLEAMRRDGFNVGGEQSGHIILSDYAHHRRRPRRRAAGAGRAGRDRAARVRTAALLRPAAAAAPECPLQERRSRWRMTASRPRSPTPRCASPGTGRLLIRKSGTEPLIRVMAEGEDSVLVAQVVEAVCEAVRRVA